MQDGIIVEAGTPQELLKKNGMFRQLWEIQNKVLDSIENEE